jgi:two-component system NtrC family sensor kinase
MSIKAKITATVFLLVACSMAVLTLLSYRYLTHTYKQTIARQHATILTMASRHIDEEILRSQAMLSLAAKGIDAAEFLEPAALQSKLEALESVRAFFDGGLQLVDAQGRQLAASPPSDRSAVSLKGLDYVAQGLAAGKPFISAPLLSDTAQRHAVLAYTVPIKRADGKVAGLLIGRNDLSLNDSLADFGQVVLGTKGRLFVVGRDRTIIMHPDRSRIMQRIAPGEDVGLDRAIAENRKATGETRTADGELLVSSAQPLNNARWLVAVQYPASEAYEPLKEARALFAVTFAVALLAIWGLTQLALRFLVRRITAPLIGLGEQVRALPNKEGAERRVTLATGDELEGLALAVNTMVGELDQKQRIQEENRELYRIIAHVTSELVLLKNPDQSIRYISSNCLALTGYTDREFLESPQLLESLVHPEDLPLFLRRRNSGVEQQADSQMELRLVTKQGTARWFNYTCHPVTDADGACLGMRGSFREISRSKELEQLLEEQRQFAESLLENTSTPLFVIDKNHRIIVWNRAIAELTGLPAREMLGTDNQWRVGYEEKRPTLSDLVLDEASEQLASLYGNFQSDPVMKGMFRAENWFRNVNGKDRYLFFDAAPVLKDGEIVAVVETLYDITDRVRAQESLRLFSQAVEQSASSIVIMDPFGVIQYVNSKFCQATGYSPEEAIGRTPALLKSGLEPPELYRKLRETVTSGREWHGELHTRRKNGTLFWESALISPITDQNGTVTHFISMKEDITARKDAERQLLKKQAELVLKHEQLSNLFGQVEKGKREWEQTMDCVDDMVAMVDSGGKIRRCNRAFMELVANMQQQLLSSDWRELLRGAGLDIDALEGQSGELFHQASRRWLTLNTYPYGEGSGEVIMLHDLTEIKEVSERLAAAYQELKATHSQLLQQEKMASIGQLAAGVAHEINNPMGFISSNLSTMHKYLERLQEFLQLQSAAVEQVAPESLREELAQARRRLKVDYLLGDAPNLLAESQDGAERVRAIVQNLKSFSRLDEAKASYADLNECLESTVTIAWNELKYKTTLKRDYGELPEVKCLPQQLNQVFLNILVNAAHAIDKQGEITISTRQEGEEVTIAIHDTGSGIPKEIVSRIFEPFFTTKEVGKGTGLGLSISYDIIKKHNGTIEVETSPETGTTFTIRLPIEGV